MIPQNTIQLQQMINLIRDEKFHENKELAKFIEELAKITIPINLAHSEKFFILKRNLLYPSGNENRKIFFHISN